MLTNIENNGAPWQFAQADRFKWAENKIMSTLKVPTVAEMVARNEQPDILFGLVALEVLMIEPKKLLRPLSKF